jgi:hypothetical protein
VFAAQVNGKLERGDVVGAQESSRKARMWCWLALALGLVANVLIWIGVVIVGAILNEG